MRASDVLGPLFALQAPLDRAVLASGSRMPDFWHLGGKFLAEETKECAGTRPFSRVPWYDPAKGGALPNPPHVFK